MTYHSFLDEQGEAYGSFETFFIDHGTDTGWYWQPCWPGCLADSDPIGPFLTEADAIGDAQW